MPDTTIDNIESVNLEKLDSDLRAITPKCMGASYRRARQQVVVHFDTGITQGEIADVIAAVRAHNPNTRTAEQQARVDLKQIAQSAVGVAFADLTTAQLKALLAVLILESGGLNNDLTIAPLNKWVR